jgi:hypothetical protein
MGAGNSTENIQNIVNNTVVSTTISSLQDESNQILNQQSLTIDCNDKEFLEQKSKTMLSCQKYWGDLYKNKFNTEEMGNFISKTCNNPWNCGGEHIKMSSTIDANLSSQQISKAISNSSSALANNLKQTAKTTTGLLQFNDKTKNVINSNSSTIIKNLAESSQKIKNGFTNVQTLKVSGGNLSYVDMTDVAKTIINIIQEDDTTMKSISNITSAIKQDAETSSFLYKIIKIFLIITGIIFGIILIIIIFYKFILNKKDNTNPSKDNTNQEV